MLEILFSPILRHTFGGEKSFYWTPIFYYYYFLVRHVNLFSPFPCLFPFFPHATPLFFVYEDFIWMSLRCFKYKSENKEE